MKMDLVHELTKHQIRSDLPTFKAGDTVSVSVRIIEEGAKERIQVFEGLVLKIQGSHISKTFTVRKVSVGKISVERTFPMNSPLIKEIKVLKIGIVRRAKLYYVRPLTGKAARIKEDKTFSTDKVKKIRKKNKIKSIDNEIAM